MLQKFLLTSLAMLVLGSVAALGQTEEAPAAPASDTPSSDRFWQATLEGGHYMVALDRITAVSRHRYVLDGAVIVDEVTIDTHGQALARFYFIQPVTAAAAPNAATKVVERGKEILDQAAERAGIDIQNMVVKKYPVTSHAKSIEYRILSEEGLTSLYESVKTSWENGRGRKYDSKK